MSGFVSLAGGGLFGGVGVVKAANFNGLTSITYPQSFFAYAGVVLSFWIKRSRMGVAGGETVLESLQFDPNNGQSYHPFRLFFSSTDMLQMVFGSYNASEGIVQEFYIVTGAYITPADGWVHILMADPLCTDSLPTFCFRNRIAQSAGVAPGRRTVVVSNRFAVGDRIPVAGQPITPTPNAFQGCIAEMFLIGDTGGGGSNDAAPYNELRSAVAEGTQNNIINRFITPAGAPVSLGNAGEAPYAAIGQLPTLYLSGNKDKFLINRGIGSERQGPPNVAGIYQYGALMNCSGAVRLP